jgi:hypothetical protein
LGKILLEIKNASSSRQAVDKEKVFHEKSRIEMGR